MKLLLTAIFLSWKLFSTAFSLSDIRDHFPPVPNDQVFQQREKFVDLNAIKPHIDINAYRQIVSSSTVIKDLPPPDLKYLNFQQRDTVELDGGRPLIDTVNYRYFIRDCKWGPWTGYQCIKNPFASDPKYLVIQHRNKTVELNGGKPCTETNAYQRIPCTETKFYAEQVMQAVVTISRAGGGLRADSESERVESNPCSPTVYGSDGKIRMLGKCDKTRRTRRNAKGQMEFYYEPVEDMVANERVKRQLQTVSTKNRDVLFLLDESGSVGSTNFDLFKAFVMGLINTFCGDIDVSSQKTRVAAMTFSTFPTVHFNFKASFDKATVVSNINGIKFKNGMTCLSTALKTAKDDLFTKQGTGSRLNEPGTERLIILLSDGCANCNTGKLIDMRKKFEDEGISFLSFFVGESDDCLKTMKDLLTGAKCYEAFRFQNWNEFKDAVDYIDKAKCTTTWQMGPSCPT